MKQKLAALVLPLFIVATPAQAAPITRMGGEISSLSLAVAAQGAAGAAGNLVVLGDSTGMTTELNGVFAGFFPTLFESWVFRINSVSVSGDVTTYALDTSIDPVAFETLIHPDGLASFAITLTEASVNNLDPDTVIFRGTKVLSFDRNATLDLSPFSAGGLFTLSLTPILPGTDLNTLFAAGGGAGGSATFTQSAGTAVTPVPEPGSTVLLCTGLAGAGLRRWRQRRPRV